MGSMHIDKHQPLLVFSKNINPFELRNSKTLTVESLLARTLPRCLKAWQMPGKPLDNWLALESAWRGA